MAAGCKSYHRGVSLTEPEVNRRRPGARPQPTPCRRKETVEGRECLKDTGRSAQLLLHNGGGTGAGALGHHWGSEVKSWLIFLTYGL